MADGTERTLRGCADGCAHLRVHLDGDWWCGISERRLYPPGCSTGCGSFKEAWPARAPVDDDGLSPYRTHAATLGRECAMRRAAYYQRIVEAREVEVERYRAVARLYDDRAQQAPAGDCDE